MEHLMLFFYVSYSVFKGIWHWRCGKAWAGTSQQDSEMMQVFNPLDKYHGSMSVYSIFGSWSFSWNESLICDFALKLMLLREDKWGTRLPSVLSWLHVLTGFKCSRERIFLSMTPGSYIKEQKKWETDLPVRLLELAIKVFCPLTADPLELPEKCFSAACAAGRRRSDPYIEDIARSSFNFHICFPEYLTQYRTHEYMHFARNRLFDRIREIPRYRESCIDKKHAVYIE